MENNIEIFLKDFLGLWQTARVYEVTHPRFLTSLDSIYQELTQILQTKPELVIGIIGDEFASGDDIFFDLSKKVIASMSYLKNLEIEKIIFKKGVSKEEIVGFLSALIHPPDFSQDSIISYLSGLGVTHISVGSILAPTQSQPKIVDQRTRNIKNYENSLVSLTDIVGSLVEDEIMDPLRLRFVSNNIMDKLLQNYHMFNDLTQVQTHDRTTFRHLLNVSVLSMFFSYKLGFSRQECINVGVAGLFHDIGKLYIEKKILQKADGLDSQEWKKIKSHTVLGASILISHKASLGVLPSIVALEHHRMFDSSGYPPTLIKHELHIASLIVSICDVYDAMSGRRSYKQDYSPEVIYKLMIKDKGKRFSPVLLTVFFRIMGVWPKDTIVSLSDERIGVVRSVNEKEIFSPLVEILSDSSKEKIDLTKNKNLKIIRSLNPYNEGKEYKAKI